PHDRQQRLPRRRGRAGARQPPAACRPTRGGGGMTTSLPSGLAIRELPAPKYYEVIYTQRWQGEDGVRSWNERALIVIDEDKGQFSATSGYGKFAYTWGTNGRSGESLHGVLYTVGFDYFMDKASTKPHRIPDHDATVRE